METTKDSSTSSIVVVMVPFLAQSHLNQLLQFAHVVSSSYDIPVHYISSTLHNSQVKSRASNPIHQLTKIHFHDYPLPISSPISQENPCFFESKFVKNAIPLFEASTHLRQPVCDLLKSLSPSTKRLVVIYDVVMVSVVQDVVCIPNGEAYSFNCGSIFVGFSLMCEALGRNDIVPLYNNMPSLKSCFSNFILDFMKRQQLGVVNFQAGEIYNSCRAIEENILESLVNDIGGEKKKVWAVGPLHQTTMSNNELRRDQVQDKWLLEWLDKQESNSVMYISFGTTSVFSEEEIKEISIGLELSGVKFIWALREGDKFDVSSTNGEGQGPQLPNGFEERMKGKGIVVREWVSQVEILRHKSIGGFMSHCGWNSCMESISMGVPLATWPLHSDQPLNALFITQVLKVGVAVLEWEQRDEVVSSSMISRAVRTLMVSNEGGEMRKRAEELGGEVRKSTEEGGVTRMEWDSFIAHIIR